MFRSDVSIDSLRHVDREGTSFPLWPPGACLSTSWPFPTFVFPFSVATRIEQRKKMDCKPFRWYLENVYPELT